MVALALSSSSPSSVSGGARVAARSPRKADPACTSKRSAVPSSSVSPISEMQMRHSSQAAGQLSDATRTDAAERVAQAERIIEFLRHRYPQKTADNVAADIGGSAETIQKMIDRVSSPSALLFTRLILAYGAPFLRAAVGAAPDWIAAEAQKQRIAELEARRAQIDAELAELI